MNNHKILCSHIDLDGAGSIILERAFHDRLGFDAVVMLDYGWELDGASAHFVENYDEIVMADLSVSEDYFTHLTLDLDKKVMIYDHHVSKENEWLSSLRGSVLDDTRCGTKIFFEEYVSKRVSRVPQVVFDLIERIDTYDRWQVDSPMWEEAMSLNRVLYGFTDYDKKGLAAVEPFLKVESRKLYEDDVWSWTDTEVMTIEKAREAEDRRYHEALDTMQLREDRRGMKFGVFSIPGKISIVCSRVLRNPKFAFLDYVIVVNSFRGINGSLSARSAQGFDCTQLAPFKGHESAAGGEIDKELAKQFLKEETCFTYKDDPEFINEGITVTRSVF
jgi:oligoribonuclease NrnB/cAMP/cGMP phosphodiesterase (DHH superfamily)